MVSWGRLICGGDSSTVQSQLHGGDFRKIRGISGLTVKFNFKVTLKPRGNPKPETRGSQISAHKPAGKRAPTFGNPPGVQRIQASGGAFAAILDDGSVVTWGHADYGGDSAAVQARGLSQFGDLWSDRSFGPAVRVYAHAYRPAYVYMDICRVPC